MGLSATRRWPAASRRCRRARESGSARTPCYAASMEDRKPPETVWRPVRDAPPDAASWGSAHYRERAARWHDLRGRTPGSGRRPHAARHLAARAQPGVRHRDRADRGSLHTPARRHRATDRRRLRRCARRPRGRARPLGRDPPGATAGSARRHRAGLRGGERATTPQPPLAEELAPASHTAPGVRARGARRQAAWIYRCGAATTRSGPTIRGGATASSTSTARPNRRAARWTACWRCTARIATGSCRPTWKPHGCTTSSSASTRSRTATAGWRGCSWPTSSRATGSVRP